MQPQTLKWTAAVVVFGVLGTAFFLRLRTATRPPTVDSRGDEKPLERARAILRNSADLPACRAILGQLNSVVTAEGAPPLPPLSPAEREQLLRLIRLDDRELNELNLATFSLLDGIHLETCLLFRDAARSVVLRPETGAPRPPQEEAALLFAWVNRQIGLDEGPESRDVTVPQVTLRRGYGTALMRSLVFLGLLDQLGHTGCLLAFPSRPSAEPRYWACGVIGSGEQLYLFDPRLGGLLPGADGKGIATLGDLRTKDSPVLKQLDFDANAKYDVTSEQAAASEVHLAPSLSSLAPRMRILEGDFLPQAGRLSFNIEVAKAKLGKALRSIGHPEEVKLADWAVRAQRTFFGEEDGGVDTTNRLKLVSDRFLVRLHGSFLEALPENIFRLLPNCLYNPPMGGYYSYFSRKISDFFFAPSQPRDLLLRGRLNEAGQNLGPTAERLREQFNHFRTNYKRDQVAEWFPQAEEAAANLTRDPGNALHRTRAQELDRRYNRQLGLLIEGTSAKELSVHVAYLQALVKQEEAELLQQRLTLSTNSEADRGRAAEGAWKDARLLWEVFHSDHGNSPMTPHARLLLARCSTQQAELAWLMAERAEGKEKEAARQKARDATRGALNPWQDRLAAEKGLPLLEARLQLRRLNERLREK